MFCCKNQLLSPFLGHWFTIFSSSVSMFSFYILSLAFLTLGNLTQCHPTKDMLTPGNLTTEKFTLVNFTLNVFTLGNSTLGSHTQVIWPCVICLVLVQSGITTPPMHPHKPFFPENVLQNLRKANKGCPLRCSDVLDFSVGNKKEQTFTFKGQVHN